MSNSGLTKRIIPCLDVTNGRVVKGTKFLDLRDAGDPVECAIAYDAQGADELVFLDITASSDERNTMVDVVERTAEECFMPLTVGGGIRTVDDMRVMLHAGADKVGVNTAAVNNPEIISDGAMAFGSQCIVVAIDAKKIQKKIHGKCIRMAGVRLLTLMRLIGQKRLNNSVRVKSF